MAKPEIGERIRQTRVARGYRQAPIAEQTRISPQAVGAIEAGVYLPNVAIAVKLARAFGMTVEKSFGDEDENYEQRVAAGWKESPSIASNWRQAVLAQIGGKIVAVAAIDGSAADTGVTIRVAAEAYGRDFIPVREERYDLAIPEGEMEMVPLRRMLDALNCGGCAREVAQLCIYDTRRMGAEQGRING